VNIVLAVEDELRKVRKVAIDIKSMIGRVNGRKDTRLKRNHKLLLENELLSEVARITETVITTDPETETASFPTQLIKSWANCA
jgi:hypothetical protein